MSGKRERLMEAATKVFAAKGYQSATVADIVREAGVAQGTFYLYFDSKKRIFLELIKDIEARIEKLIVECVLGQRVTEEEAYEASRQFYQRLLHTYWQDRQMAAIFLREAVAADPEFEAMRQQFMQQIYEHVSRNIRRNIEHGLLRPCDAKVIAVCLVGMVEKVALELLTPAAREADISHLAEQLAQFELYGLLTKAEPEKKRWNSLCGKNG